MYIVISPISMKRDDIDLKNTLKPALLLVWLIKHRKLLKKDILTNLGIKPRTLKKYVIELNKLLRSGKIEIYDVKKRDEIDGNGNENGIRPSIKEVKNDRITYLELVDFKGEYALDYINEIVMLHLLKSIFSHMKIKYYHHITTSIYDNLLNSLKSKVDIKLQLNELNNLFYYHPYAPKDYSSSEDIVRTIIQCILNRRKMEVKYQPLSSRTDNPEPFILKPYSLVVHQNVLYLLGEDENNNIKTYSIDRFKSVRKLSEEFHRRPNFNPSMHLNDYIGIIGDGERCKFEIIFRDNPALHKILRERMWFRDQSFEMMPDGRLKMTFTSCKSIELDRWINSWGEDIVEKIEKKDQTF